MFRLPWISDVVSSVYVNCSMDTKMTLLCYTTEYFAQARTPARSDYPRLQEVHCKITASKSRFLQTQVPVPV